jgi:PAS domain S-box-containing protein
MNRRVEDDAAAGGARDVGGSGAPSDAAGEALSSLSQGPGDELFHVFAETVSDAILVIDTDSRIHFANRAAEKIFGYEPAELLGQSLTLLMPEYLRLLHRAGLTRYLETGERHTNWGGVELPGLHRDGRDIELEIAFGEFTRAGRHFFTGIARDISERRRAEREREELLAREQEARAEAEAALRLRDEFLSIASHELRTPIASLSGYAQLILRQLSREGHLEPERVAQALDVIKGQADKLARLISQLLDISRLEAGKLALECQPTDLVALVGQVVAGVRARFDGHPVAIAAPPSLEAEVDPLRLEQVLNNLLDNAIKYSPEGGPIEVAVSRSADDALEIAVRDRGLGIPPEKRARIFERFYQAHGNGHRSGMGLGLYVSRQVVELHGGEIRAEFPEDGGSRFIVRLPVTR